ncbi:TPA: hypothetical protein ACH3X1_010651 [Trebouxia sp. C0004]
MCRCYNETTRMAGWFSQRAVTQSPNDNRSDQMNPNNPAYTSRGGSGGHDDNRANQLNPNNPGSSGDQSGGDDDNRANQLNPNNPNYGNSG